MSTVTTETTDRARDRAERIRKSIYRSNGSLHGNSSSDISIEIVMKEWAEALDKRREALLALRKPWDKRRPAEDELNHILLIIQMAFSFCWGDVPDDLECSLCDSGDKGHMETCEKLMLWNYPEFVRAIRERAGNLNITIQRLINRSFQPLVNNSGNIRQKVLEELFGEKVFNSRIKPLFNAPEEQRSRIKENRKVKQRKIEEEQKFFEIAGRKNI